MGNTVSTKQKALDIIAGSKALIVNTIGLDGYPNTRIFYSHGADDFTIYFSSGAKAVKVAEIAANPRVSAYYENTGQQLETWKNVTIYGETSPLQPGSVEYQTAVERISAKSPNFKKRAENGQLGDSTLFRIDPIRVKVLDFAADPRVEEFTLELERSY